MLLFFSFWKSYQSPMELKFSPTYSQKYHIAYPTAPACIVPFRKWRQRSGLNPIGNLPRLVLRVNGIKSLLKDVLHSMITPKTLLSDRLILHFFLNTTLH